MAKKKRAELPDDDGYVCSGIYSEFVGTAESHPEEFAQDRRYGSRSILETSEDLFARMDGELMAIFEKRKAQLTPSEFRSDPCISDTVSAISLLEAVQTMVRTDHIPSQLVHYLIQLGELYERAKVRPFEPLVQSGQQRIQHAEDMRHSKQVADAQKRQAKRQRAEDAMKWARDKFPTAAQDDYIGFLKDKAAEYLGKSRDTLDRWLKK